MRRNERMYDSMNEETYEKESILVVDDDESTCRSLSLIFGKKGYRVEAARTGREAIKKAQKKLFNAALLDIRLPDMEGVELVAPLRKILRDIALIMVTAYPSLETAVRTLSSGVSAYITKPLNMDEVLAKVTQAFERQRLVMEQRSLYQEAQRELAEHKKTEERMRRMAYHDPLTALPNRALLNDRLTVALHHAQRKKQKLAVMLLDLDCFKNINDSLGHSMGDELLRAVGNRLTGLMRKSDTVARMGGDEFMLILPEITGNEDAAKIAQNILEAIRKPFLLNGHELHVTTSVGVAMYPNHSGDADILIKKADIAMYRVKKCGRDHYQGYTPRL